MGAVQLDGVEADAMGAARGGGESVDEPRYLFATQRGGWRRSIAAGDGRSRHRLPTVLPRQHGLATLPRRQGRGLSPGMGELDADLDFAVTATEGHHPGKGAFVVVIIESETIG